MSLLHALYHRRNRLDREHLAVPPAAERTYHHEDRGPVEQPVQGAQQRVVAGEEVAPLVRGRVAGEDERVRPLLLVAAVDDIEEQVGALAVQPAPAHLADDEAGRLHHGVDHRLGPVLRDRLLQPGLELGRLRVVGLVPQLAALVVVGLGEVGLADALWPDERDVLARVQVRQGRQLPERPVVPALYPREVEALEGLGSLLGDAAEPQQGLDDALADALEERPGARGVVAHGYSLPSKSNFSKPLLTLVVSSRLTAVLTGARRLRRLAVGVPAPRRSCPCGLT